MSDVYGEILPSNHSGEAEIQTYNLIGIPSEGMPLILPSRPSNSYNVPQTGAMDSQDSLLGLTHQQPSQSSLSFAGILTVDVSQGNLYEYPHSEPNLTAGSTTYGHGL